MKKGYQLTFFTLESCQYQNKNIGDYLEEKAEEIGISGITVLKASKGVGQDGKWHSASFFELADQPLEIIMILEEDKCLELFTHLEKENLNLFYTKAAIEYGII